MQTDNPLISILALFYNCAHLMTRTLGSLDRQTNRDFETVLVDNTSTDNGYELIELYKASHPERNIVIKRNTTKTVCEGRALGYSLSAGRYVTFVDGDDWLDDTFVEEFTKSIKENNFPVAILCPDKSITDEKVIISIDSISKPVCIWSRGSLHGYMIKRPIVERTIELVADTQYKDFHFSRYLHSVVKSVAVIEESLYNYYVNPDSVGGNKRATVPGYFVEPFRDLCTKVNENVVPDLSDDADNYEHLLYSMLAHYYSIVYQGSARLKYQDMHRRYVRLYEIVSAQFPEYRKSKFNSLFTPNFVSDAFRRRIWLSVLLESWDSFFGRHFFMSALLLVYYLSIALSLYKVKHYESWIRAYGCGISKQS